MGSAHYCPAGLVPWTSWCNQSHYGIQTFMKIFFHPLFLRKKQVPVFDASILFFFEEMAGRGFK
jgi:hypothetical protein